MKLSVCETGTYSGVEQLVARVAHNHKVVGSNPTPATSLLGRWLSG